MATLRLKETREKEVRKKQKEGEKSGMRIEKKGVEKRGGGTGVF